MRKFIFAVAVVALAVALSFTVADQAFAQSANAANKVHSSGSTLAVVGPTAPATILSTSLKTSTNADLLISVALECAVSFTDFDQLSTNVSATAFASSFSGFGGSGVGSDFSAASDTDALMVQVEVWVTVDGVPVPVATGDNGRITFCRVDRTSSAFQNVFLTVSNSINSTATFTTASTGVSLSETAAENIFQAGKSANAFNWHAKNVGQGTHTVAVKAQLLQAASGFTTTDSFAFTNAPLVSGVVGKRTLVVEPVLPGK